MNVTRLEDLTHERIDQIADEEEMESLLNSLSLDVEWPDNVEHFKSFMKDIIDSKKNINNFELIECDRMILDNYRKIQPTLKQVLNSFIVLLEHGVIFEDGIILEEKRIRWVETAKGLVNELNEEYCSVIVAGDTNAGKSSFLNLLIGEKILPENAVACTSILCTIHTSDKKSVTFRQTEKYARLLTRTVCKADEIIDLNELTEDKKARIESIIRKGTPHGYDEAHFYWPLRFLKDHVALVDSPGIRDTADLQEKTFSYLQERCAAFIFILDSTNSNGLKAWSRQLIETAYQKICEKGHTQHRLQNEIQKALFIVNKWDSIENHNPKELQETRVRIINEIKALWKDVDVNSQIFFISTRQLHSVQTNLNIVHKELRRIEFAVRTLIARSLDSVVHRGFRYIDQVASDIENCFHKIIVGSVSKHFGYEEEMERIQKTKEKLRSIEDTAESVITSLEKKVGLLFDKYARSLYNHLTSEETRKNLNITESEIPKRCRTKDSMTPTILNIAATKIACEIKKWNESYTDKYGKKAFDLLHDEFQKLYVKHFQDLGNEMGDMKQSLVGDIVNQLTENPADSWLGNPSNEVLTDFEKALLVVSCVLLIPIVAVGAVFAAPLLAFAVWQDNNVQKEFVAEWTDKPKEVFSRSIQPYIEQLTPTSVKVAYLNTLQDVYIFWVRDLQTRVKEKIKEQKKQLDNLTEEVRQVDELVARYAKPCDNILRLRHDVNKIQFQHTTLPGWYVSAELYGIVENTFPNQQFKLLSETVYSCLYVCPPTEQEINLLHVEKQSLEKFHWTNGFKRKEIFEKVMGCEEHFLRITRCIKLYEPSRLLHVLSYKCQHKDGQIYTLASYFNDNPSLLPISFDQPCKEKDHAIAFILKLMLQLVAILCNLNSLVPAMVTTDLRPETVLLIEDCGNKILKLYEFDVEKRCDSQMESEPNARVYLPPEVHDGYGCYHKSDVFSFGVLMWNILHFGKVTMTEQKRFISITRRSDISLDDKPIEENPTATLDFPDSNLPLSIKELIGECTRLIAGQRPTIIEVKQKLEKLISSPELISSNFNGQ